jgi:hypothetical protein
VVSALRGDEVCDEFEWLVANGMSALMAAETLGRNVAAMSRMLYRYGRTEHIAELEKFRRFEANMVGKKL